MISVQEAEYIIQAEKQDYGVESVRIEQAQGRILAEEISADRDFPPYNRVTMDGIAIYFDNYKKGQRTFKIKGTQAAGANPIETEHDECIEIMTGAALPATADTIIRYEDVTIVDNAATVNIGTVQYGQNIHYKGSDKIKNQLLVEAGRVITPAIINTAASVGKTELLVRRLPKIVVISTGEELISIEDEPTDFQVRRSNSYAIAAVLQKFHITATMMHINDDEAALTGVIGKCLHDYDVVILSGGVSMGKYDYLPKALKELLVEQKFHKVKQRPGKPFWFGSNHDYKLVFAFPGNPVSAFMCMYRYFVPWLQTSLGTSNTQPAYAVLSEDYSFKPDLQYFLQVKVHSDEGGKLIATPSEGNGSGDFVNLLHTDAFMELPERQTNFKKGEAYRIWPYQPIM